MILSCTWLDFFFFFCGIHDLGAPVQTVVVVNLDLRNARVILQDIGEEVGSVIFIIVVIVVNVVIKQILAINIAQIVEGNYNVACNL